MSLATALTDRQRQILALIAEGRSDREIAAATGLACQTVRHTTRAIYRRLKVQKVGNARVLAAVWWVRFGATLAHQDRQKQNFCATIAATE